MEVSIRMPLFSQLEGVRCTLFNLYCSSGDMVTSRKSNRSCYNLHEWPAIFISLSWSHTLYKAARIVENWIFERCAGSTFITWRPKDGSRREVVEDGKGVKSMNVVNQKVGDRTAAART